MFDVSALAALGLALRPSGDQDARFLRLLFEAARPDAAILAAWPEAMRRSFLDQQFQFQTVHYALTYPDADRLVILGGGEPVGRIILAYTTEEWCVVDIALLPPWRGRGLGTLLLRQIQTGAARAQVSKLHLTVDFTNPARRLYERLGFAAVEEAIPNIEMTWSPGDQLKTA